ncbi:MAG: alkaline phosphatase D family protein, partial [Rikenellaceae bacterium]
MNNLKEKIKLILAAALSLSAVESAQAQATNQPKVDGVDVGIFVFDNMVYYNLNYAGGPLPLKEFMLYKSAEYYFTLNPLATYSTLYKHNRFAKFQRENPSTHIGGPMLGCIKSDGVSVWVRTIEPKSVRVIAEGADEKFEFSGETLVKNDMAVTIELTGLRPNTKYRYRTYVGDDEIATDRDCHFTTLSNKAKGETRIVFGADYHRFGLCNRQLSQTIIDRDPNAFLILGDIAVQDRENKLGYHCLDFFARDLYPAWQNLSSKVPIYTTWDDHDYFCDDGYNVPKNYTAADKEGVWRVFKNSWVNPSYGFGEEGKGVFHHSTIGAADVILLDNRYFREKGSLLGDEQQEWLKSTLLECEAPFIIIGCGTMFSDYVSSGKDSWGKFSPDAREQIFDLIEENNIKGVLLISGDRHGSRGFKMVRESGFTLYEFGSGSLGALGGQPDTTEEWGDMQLYGHSEIFAFGEFLFDTTKRDP